MIHTNFTPHAFITLANTGGIEIMVNHSADGVCYRFNYGQDNLDDEEIFESEILYTLEEDSTAHFVHNSANGETTHYFLNEAMRIN